MYSPDINKIELLGNLGQDPIIKPIGEQGEVAELFIATNYASSKMEEMAVDWHKVTVFGNLVDVCKEYFAKGSRVFIEGRIRQNRYMDAENKLQFRTDIVANKILLQPSAKSNSE